MERPLPFETGGPSWIIVLLEKQVHLQNDVGSVRDSSHEFLVCESGRGRLRLYLLAARATET